MATEKPIELTYPLRTAARLTGLSPELLRAWERRHQVVTPQRTPGGTRRYTATDLHRLRLVKAAVDAGHRIGQVALLDASELERRIAATRPPSPTAPIAPIVAALERLDALETQRLLSLQLSATGPVRFAREIAIPLVHEIGDRWADGRLAVASEHLASGVLRAMLGSALQPTAFSPQGPRLVFATPAGERHELGLQMAALTALGAGGNPIYLGAELPADELLGAVVRTDADALALSVVTLSPGTAGRALLELREGMADDVCLWVGGAGARELELPAGVEQIDSLDQLEARVALLAAAPRRRA